MPLEFIDRKDNAVRDANAVLGKRKQTRNQKHYCKKIIDLEYDQRLAIDNLLLSGESPNDTAEHIRKHLGLFQDMKMSSLVKMMSRYRESYILPRIALAVLSLNKENSCNHQGEGNALSKSFSFLQNEISIKDSFERLINLQEHRLAKALAVENSFPFATMDRVSREVKVMSDLLVSYGRFKRDSGMLDKWDGKIGSNIQLSPAAQEHKRSIVIGAQVAEATEKMIALLGWDKNGNDDADHDLDDELLN